MIESTIIEIPNDKIKLTMEQDMIESRLYIYITKKTSWIEPQYLSLTSIRHKWIIYYIQTN